MNFSKIEWTHHTVNFWWGCTKVSPGCFACYALAMARIWKAEEVQWGPTGKRWLRQNKALSELLKLDASAEKRGVRERVFINSMSDTFEDHPDLVAARTALWLAVYGVAHLEIILLTKRPENVMRMVPEHWKTDWPAHVWIGTTVENQEMADARIPVLLEIPAKVRFLSCEPLLGPVDIYGMRPPGTVNWSPLGADGIDWVICGGESGTQARPMHPAWARSLRDQCKAAGVPFHFKQWGEWREPVDGEEYNTAKGRLASPAAFIVAADGTVHCFENDRTAGGRVMLRVGKKAAGRLLDGAEHNEFPEVRP